MSVKLEEYLFRRRKDLDVETPDDEAIWGKISGSLDNELQEIKRLNSRIKFLRIRNFVATALILFSLGYIANDVVNRKKTDDRISLSSINAELGQTEARYKELVSYKTTEAKTIAASDDKIINQLFTEINNLDQIYAQAMKDLRELGPNDRVINTIFSTYEQKIRLLELIILESNKTGNHENNEKISL